MAVYLLIANNNSEGNKGLLIARGDNEKSGLRFINTR
jgi:hypothetical protein